MREQREAEREQREAQKLIPVVAVRFDVGSSRRQHSRAGGAGSDDVLETSDDALLASRLVQLPR